RAEEEVILVGLEMCRGLFAVEMLVDEHRRAGGKHDGGNGGNAGDTPAPLWRRAAAEGATKNAGFAKRGHHNVAAAARAGYVRTAIVNRTPSASANAQSYAAMRRSSGSNEKKTPPAA